MRKLLAFTAALLLLGACTTYSEQDLNTFDKQIKTMVKKSGLPYERSESGLYYYVEKPGEGREILPTDYVSFTYEGKLKNGQVFDGNNKIKPVEFQVKSLIAGWQEAMLYVKKGGKIHLIIPPNLGYGDRQLDDIPANSILIFQLEVKDIK